MVYFPKVSVIVLEPCQRVYPKPLCILFFDTKGIQWVGANARDEKGGLRTLVDDFPVHMGVMEKPLNSSLNS